MQELYKMNEHLFCDGECQAGLARLASQASFEQHSGKSKKSIVKS